MNAPVPPAVVPDLGPLNCEVSSAEIQVAKRRVLGCGRRLQAKDLRRFDPSVYPMSVSPLQLSSLGVKPGKYARLGRGERRTEKNQAAA